ncbi:MAG: Cna B-type domain-containing protein [Oribacterium sp.]|nr:Cna B-type domain-containing protein [Oribacterium sp.]
MQKKRLTKALAVVLTASMLMQNMPISVFADNIAEKISTSAAETSSEEDHRAEDTQLAKEEKAAKTDEDVGETGEAETNAETEETGAEGESGSTEKTGIEETTAPIEETGAEKVDVKAKENSVAGGVNTSADTSVKKDDSTSNETSEDGSKTHGEAEEVKEDSVEAEERKASDSELPKDDLSLDDRKRLRSAGSFESTVEGNHLHVRADFEDDVFPEDTHMVLKAITDQAALKEAGEKAVADAEDTDDKALKAISILGVDISFYAPNDEDEDEKVQPADEKDVTITLTMPEDKAEASEETTTSEDGTDKTDAQNSTVVKVIHVEDENNSVVLSDVQEDGQDVMFTSGSFSPFYVVQLASKKVEQKDFVFKTYWKNSVENNADNTPRFAYTNEDFDKTNPETQKDLQFRPDTNNLVNTTVQLSLALKGDENVHYPAGSIKIDVPESYYEGWDDDDIHRVAVNDDLKRLDPLYWMIPEAPKTNTLSDFNYTVITKDVNGKEETYYELTNHKDLTGGTVFDTEIAYRLRPTMLKVEDTETADGTHVGHYSKELPISVSIDQDGADPVFRENTLSVDVQTKVNPTKLTMGPSKADPNNGIFFNWDSAWGEKPNDADQYFYIVWYLDLRRGAGSTQPFNYVLNLDETKTQGGKLIGAKKYTVSKEEAYEQPGYIFSRMDKSYTGLYGGTSAIGKTWPGIMDNPVNNTIYCLDFCNYRTENLNSNWLDQVYCLLFRYPISKVQEATDRGIDVAQEGFPVSNDGISITEYWRDGHTVTHADTKVDGAQVKTMPNLGGGPGSVKQVVDANPKQSRTIVGLQSIIADGSNDALLIPKNYHWSFALNADSVASTCTWNAENGTYTANGNSVEILDRPLTLFTDINNKGYAIYKSPEADISDATPLTLNDDDYRYTSFYITGAGEYDISYNSELGWQRNPRANTDYKSYEPYEIWTRAANSSTWTHFGDVKINEHQQYVFINSETQKSQIVSSSARVDFPEDTVQIYTKHNSKFYESQFSLIYNLKLKATDRVINRLKKDMNSGLATYVGSFADKVHKSEDTMETKGVIGQYWNQVAYRMDALSSKVYLYKEKSNLKNDSTKSEETYDISVHFYNDCHSSNEFATAKYMKPYMFTSGVFYDLLPAGTYVKEDEITLGTREGPGTTISKEKISSYMLEMIDNWENSGQTMMKITFSVPEDETHRTWHDYWYGARLNYKLHNSYTNITDRGTNVVNTVAFVNTSGDDVIFNTNVNKGNIDKANIDKKEYFKKLVTEENDKYHEVALAQATLVYDPVTVLQAAFTNRVESDTNPSYEQDNTAYLGDKYSYRLQYTAASDTRTDNMVIYDVLDGDQKKKVGDVSWIDVSSIDAKRSYDASNPNTTDTCKPVVYYATVVPTNAQKNIDEYKNIIWFTEAPEDKSMIKAIAIDCRKTDSGKNFVLDKKGTLVAYVHCTASSQKDWAERVNTNDATLSARLFNGDTAGGAETKTIDVKSTLHLIAPNLEIHKASNPESGTKASPSEIGNGPDTALTYTLTIENKANTSYPGISNVVVHDTLPEGLTLVGTDSTDRMKSIMVHSDVLGLNPAKPITDTSIKLEVSGQDLNFTLPQFTTGMIEISIPVIRKDGIHESARYENTAEIVKAGNVVYDNSDDDHQKICSNTTYHKSSAHTLTVKPNGGTWNNSTQDSVFPLYCSETKEIPVPTREGYTFTGWIIESGNGTLQPTTDTSTSGTRALPAADQTMLFTMADTDTVLQAKWTINWYRVTVTKTFRGIDALPSNFAIKNTYDATTTFTTANASGDGSAARPYTWTILVPYHTDIKFTETGYDASGYSVTTSAHTANATGSSTAASGTITVPANDNASVSFDNVYSYTSYEVTKTWAGPEKYMKQSIPEKLTVELYKDGAKVENAEQTLSADNYWSATWGTLPDKNPDGSKIQYSVKEVLNDQRFEQGTPVASASEIGTKASITNTLKTVNVTAIKTWKDQNNKFAIRPESINIHLYQNGVPIGEDAAISVNADGTWTHTFEDVPKCDAHGQDYVYTVKEDSVNGYNTSYEGMTIINTLITTDVTVQVSWKDFDDQWKLRPETVHITLLKNGKPFNGSKIDLSDEDDWTHVFTDLPLEDAEGNAYIYTVIEDDIHAYDKKIDHTQKTLLTITNTLKTRDITATKNWVDDDNKKKTRPDSITLRLTQREKVASAFELSPASDEIWATASEISPASDGSWTTSFDHLPVEDKKGHRYCYDVSEDAVTGYTSSIAANSDHSHYTVTNTICTPVVSDPSIKKVIEGDTPSENATFQFTLKALRQLTADGKEIPGAELPMPEGADGQVKTVTVQGAGEYEFGNIEFSMPGTYIYQMSEVDTRVERYTYDTSVYIVTYKVTQNDDHLDVVRTITKNGAEAETTQFTNMYKKPSGSSGGGSHVGPGPKPGNEPGPTGGPDDTAISTPTPDEGRVLGASRGPAPVQNGGRVLGASRNAGTGDMSLMLVWFVLMLAALGLLAGYVIYIRKHRRNRT